MTAKELIEKMEGSTTEELMIEFAKIHVREALRSAHHSAVSEMDGRGWTNVYNKRFLLECYPESKII